MIIKTEFKFLRLLIFFVLSLCSLSIFAQDQTLTVTSTGSLGFGKFSRQGGGTITIEANAFNTRTSSGGFFFLNSPLPTSVRFDISTKKGADKFVNVMAAPITLDGPGGSLELTLNFNQDSFRIDKYNDAVVYMGGVLTVDSGDLPGYYSGTVNVIFSYQ